MKSIDFVRATSVSFAMLLVAACAGTGSIIASPTIELTDVRLTSANFQQQTFLLSFDVSNPNPFPLPVKTVEYRLTLDQQKFAGGETQGSFTVPAGGSNSFAISVELDLLKSAKHMTSLFGGRFRENVSYELQGRFAVDIPLVSPVPFSAAGVVNMTQTASDHFE
jgi:LEA14-like dessication related protein